ncbi:MAG: hypothetical protein BIFFINMI_00775 [Phycisphaerae bacterium]|nr:hypothetical protein [Phycisphaerae bacterium]
MRIGRRSLGWAAIAAVLLGGTGQALAIIKVALPVSKVYNDAGTVAAGQVTAVADDGVVECTLGEVYKGRPPRGGLTIEAPDWLAAYVQVGQPAVAFIQGDKAIFHLADDWRAAERGPGGRWVVTENSPMFKNYPGRTVALVDILREIKAGRRGIQDGIGHEFVGSLIDRGDLGVAKPTFLVAADVNADQKLDLVVGAADGVRLFLADGDGYKDATEAWGLKGVAARLAAAGDVNGDGRTDLLLGPSLWLGGAGRFTRSAAKLDLPPDDAWLAATLADADGDKRADVAVLTRTGGLTVLHNPGPDGGDWAAKSVALWPDKREARAAVFSPSWGDDGGCYVLVVHADDIVRYPVGAATAPRSDFRRLTGVALADYPKMGPTPREVDLCVGLDYDGNGHLDLLLVTRGGGVTLANRGYGAFLINGFMPQQFRTASTFKPNPRIPKLPFPVDPSLCVAPGKLAGKRGTAQNLLLLRSDGRLFELDNFR